MRKFVFLTVVALSAVAAYGDSVPIDNLPMGSVSLTPIDVSQFGINWSFSNGGSQTLSGIDSWGTCIDFAPGGSSCNPNIVIGLNQTGASLNGSVVGIFGTVSIGGANFALPASGTTFSVTLPVLFNGSFSTCPFNPLGGCTALNTTGIFNINGNGTVTLNFTGLQTANGTVWEFSSGTYSLTSTPEPASIVLLGTGALAIVGKLRRGRS